MKTHFCLLRGWLLTAIAIVLFASAVQVRAASDKSHGMIIALCDNLIDKPLDVDPAKNDTIMRTAGILFRWFEESKDVTLNLNGAVLDLFKFEKYDNANGVILPFVFIVAQGRYCLENNIKKVSEKAQLEACMQTFDYYVRNKEAIGSLPQLDMLIPLSEKERKNLFMIAVRSKE